MRLCGRRGRFHRLFGRLRCIGVQGSGVDHTRVGAYNVDGDESGDPDILLVRSPEGADLASIDTQLYERPLFTTGGPRGTSFLWVDPGAPSLRSVDGSGKEVASVDVKSALGDERTGYCDDIAIAPTDAPNADTEKHSAQTPCFSTLR
ncbi:hypothetical protein [Antrihabitans spumae]|uniref:Uncharacterized protein n=1 Tax=Antrihabitans spumae TaxID=3373370 RepID=A0ABW7K464_9NOCA